MTRQQLVMLIDALPDEQIDMAATCLLYLRDQGTPEETWLEPEFQSFIKRRIQESLEKEERGEFLFQEGAKERFRQWRDKSSG